MDKSGNPIEEEQKTDLPPTPDSPAPQLQTPPAKNKVLLWLRCMLVSIVVINGVDIASEKLGNDQHRAELRAANDSFMTSVDQIAPWTLATAYVRYIGEVWSTPTPPPAVHESISDAARLSNSTAGLNRRSQDPPSFQNWTYDADHRVRDSIDRAAADLEYKRRLQMSPGEKLGLSIPRVIGGLVYVPYTLWTSPGGKLSSLLLVVALVAAFVLVTGGSEPNLGHFILTVLVAVALIWAFQLALGLVGVLFSGVLAGAQKLAGFDIPGLGLVAAVYKHKFTTSVIKPLEHME